MQIEQTRWSQSKDCVPAPPGIPATLSCKPYPCTHINEIRMEPAVNQCIFEPLHRRVYLLIVDGSVMPPVLMTRLR